MVLFSMISLSLGFLFDIPSSYLNRCFVLFLDFLTPDKVCCISP